VNHFPGDAVGRDPRRQPEPRIALGTVGSTGLTRSASTGGSRILAERRPKQVVFPASHAITWRCDQNDTSRARDPRPHGARTGVRGSSHEDGAPHHNHTPQPPASQVVGRGAARLTGGRGDGDLLPDLLPDRPKRALTGQQNSRWCEDTTADRWHKPAPSNMGWHRIHRAHNPKVAGSNPAPATIRPVG